MKVLLFACLAVAAFASLPVDVQGALKTFVDFKNTFNRQYSSAGEEAHRFGCFHSNVIKINQLNSRGDKAVYGINKFTDLCADEFKIMYHNLNVKKTNKTVAPVPTKTAPLDSFDWRDHGAVNAVKDQAQCGSCWAFSTVAALEGAWFVGGHGLNSFSEEELVQCATSAGAGCNGGDMIAAIQWVIQNGGIDTEADYPYTSGTGVTGNCDNSKLGTKVGKFATLLQAGTDESTYAQYLVAHGVLSIGVDAQDGWQTYIGGVKTACAGSQVDHGVAIVGYGVDGTTPYWIIRNSWGQSWGENGYIRVQRGINCDLLTTEVSTAVSL